MRINRRTVLKGTALAAVSAVTGPLPSFAAKQVMSDDQFHGLKVGICSYSLRAFPLDQVLADAQRLGVRYISLKDVHLPLSSSAEQRRQSRQQAQDAGLSITSCGVIYLKNEADQMRQALDYVRDLGAGIAVVGVSREMLPILDRVIKDYDLKAAIHNHGPNDKLFPSPLEVYQAIQPFDRKIGVCMDIGHTFRMHEDLLSDVTKTADRLYSMHFKDLDSDKIDAKGVPVGTGVLPVIPLLRELLHLPYSGEVQLEYEVEAKDPLPGMAESLGFMRGSLQTMS
jgi:sugar phosphate isomerase/epimerase